jgi:branched-chain amino acid transport system permease protein
MDYIWHIVVLIGLYSILTLSLNLIAGYTGLLSVAHAGLYGVGAYTAALLSLHAGTPFILNLTIGMILTAAVAVIVAIPSLRLYDDYFVIATFGFQMILFSLFNNWMSLTQGPLGLTGIPRPLIFGWQVGTNAEYAVLVVVVAFLSFLILHHIVCSPFGRTLRAIREDEVFAQSLGKDVWLAKVLAFVISAAFAGLAGGLYAHYVMFIDPTTFTILESILLISMVIIGGAGNMLGAVVGATLLVILPEVLRFLGLPDSVAANIRQMVYGGLLVVFMLYRPQGLLGRSSVLTGKR